MSSGTIKRKPLSRKIGGVNLTPLISALLLAGIKLALEQKKKAKTANAAKSASKSAKSTKSAKAAKAAKPLKRQRKTI